MNLKLILYGFLLCYPVCSLAVIVRHDLPASDYLVLAQPEYVIDLPYEGHGALIAPNWIVTVAHTIFDDYTGVALTIGTKEYEIAKVVIHPKYQVMPKTLLQGAKTTKNIMAFLASNHDIALIKLKTAVTDIKPATLNTNTNEVGHRFRFFGKGATGTGLTGDIKKTKKDKVLRQGENVFTEASSQWLIYTFDAAPIALPLEAMQGSGDSGTPTVVNIDNAALIMSLMSWQYWLGDVSQYQSGLYARQAYSVRISAYVGWINQVIQSNAL
jgi:hypothetical protein